MHNNYHLIRILTRELEPLLKEAVLVEAYSHNKEEAVFSFITRNNKEFYLVANLGSEFSCIYFPEVHQKPKRKFANIFGELYGLKVQKIIQAKNDRLFVIQLEGQYKLAFKLYGNRSNVLLLKEDKLVKLFKNNLKQDLSFSLESIDRSINVSLDYFKSNHADWKKVYFTLGDIAGKYFDTLGFSSLKEAEQHKIIQDAFTALDIPSFYITDLGGKIVLSLFKIGKVLSCHSSAIEALNHFYVSHFKYNHFEGLKKKIFEKINVQIRSSLGYIQKSSLKKTELESEYPLEKLADVIMANLTNIPANAEKIKLFDFYNNRDMEVCLKKDMSPQKYAETLYKKSKNRPKEIEMLKEQIRKREEEVILLKTDAGLIAGIESYKLLEPLVEKYLNSADKSEKEETERFKTYEYSGFKIFVGRNAGNNDELTQKFAHKNDLWLHAKDVAGSHVVIQHQSGKKFPKNVIEYAASLAAYYSKRKNESLCPVVYTEKKYVRKVKGAAKGEVMV
ncbi:MAG: NFACT RNA binding domain-containing protein, partial [Cytophagaceae bacterium]|nr:NFACT RNA binding domain-containing protein [Cytophagaceae bacterium]